MMIRRVAASLAVLTVVGVGGGLAVTAAFAAPAPVPSDGSGHAVAQAAGSTVSFTAKRKTIQQLDLGAQGPSIGDETLIGGQITQGSVKGFTSAECTMISTENHGISQCEVDFLLSGGTLVMRGTGTGKSPGVSLAVVGGTGRYAGAAGSGTLTPTATGSNVTLHLR